MDARPSDAIALGMRCGAPLYVTQKVMNTAGVVLEDKEGTLKEQVKDAADPKGGAASPATVLDQLKAKLEKAITQERYEDAAKLRDQISHLIQSHGKN